MNGQNALFFDIGNIYVLIHKSEGDNFCYECPGRQWDGFVAITAGICTFWNENALQYTLNKGDIVFLRRGERYTIKAEKPCAYYTSAFDFSKTSEETLSMLPKVWSCGGLQMKHIGQMTEKWQRMSPDSHMFCKIQLLQLYYDILQTRMATDSLYEDDGINRAIEFIHANFKRNFQSAEIAAHCSLSESYLRKKFSDITGMTIWKYRDELRIRMAKELLASGLFSVKETAYELGFCDVYYFTKFFLKHTNVTPGRFVRTPLEV